jgi:ATP-dependent Clp protease ATP-binding subunit ClpB
LNRVDQIIVFDPLNEKQIGQIAQLQLNKLQDRLSRQDIKLTVTKEAEKLLAHKGYDPDFGARPLKRVIQDKILDELSLQIIEGKVKPGDTVRIDAKNNDVVVN